MYERDAQTIPLPLFCVKAFFTTVIPLLLCSQQRVILSILDRLLIAGMLVAPGGRLVVLLSATISAGLIATHCGDMSARYRHDADGK